MELFANDPTVSPVPGGGESVMEGITTALTSAFTTIQGDILGVLAAVVPVAIVLFGGLYAVRWGKKAFKAAAN